MQTVAENTARVNMNQLEKKEQRKQQRRQNIVDRRLGLDRRRGPGIRRDDDRKSAEEGEMTDEQFEFVMAVDQYKRQNNRPFPTWTEVLDVIKALGYRKVAEPQDFKAAKTKELVTLQS
jgi:hypothetical protein